MYLPEQHGRYRRRLGTNLQREEQRQKLKAHHQRLRAIRPTLSTWNDTHQRVAQRQRLNRRRNRAQELRQREIRRQNEILVDKITSTAVRPRRRGAAPAVAALALGGRAHDASTIARTSKPNAHGTTPQRGHHSLNYEVRKRERDRIARENLALAKRIIQKKSFLNHRQWVDHSRKHDRLLGNLSRFVEVAAEEDDYETEQERLDVPLPAYRRAVPGARATRARNTTHRPRNPRGGSGYSIGAGQEYTATDYDHHHHHQLQQQQQLYGGRAAPNGDHVSENLLKPVLGAGRSSSSSAGAALAISSSSSRRHQQPEAKQQTRPAYAAERTDNDHHHQHSDASLLSARFLCATNSGGFELKSTECDLLLKVDPDVPGRVVAQPAPYADGSEGALLRAAASTARHSHWEAVPLQQKKEGKVVYIFRSCSSPAERNVLRSNQVGEVYVGASIEQQPRDGTPINEDHGDATVANNDAYWFVERIGGSSRKYHIFALHTGAALITQDDGRVFTTKSSKKTAPGWLLSEVARQA